ncbi:hypothetical protein [Tritonibacter scottomollicae]|uniref:hypothetical protein n=1 Tax=Tritonibacter scottomollicae TaxID=483013 RepID=UPI003AA8A145
MTDKPILFSGPMVQAILREIRDPGTGKTQTRRILPQSHPKFPHHNHLSLDVLSDPSEVWFWDGVHDRVGASYRLPFHPGQRLWVREAHYLTDDGESEYAVYAAEQDDVDEHLSNMQTTMASHPSIDWSKHLRLRPSLHMPRWASRITLEVTDVRVQRLQEITLGDICAEGLASSIYDFKPVQRGFDAWISLWDSLNADRAPWASNPWVVAVSFRPHLTNIDKMEKAG